MITTNHEIHFRSGRGSKKRIASGKAPAIPVGRVPRVAKLMALAIRLDQLIRDGHVADQAELARLGYVTRARLTQIMNLLNLAPDIQEEILHLPLTVHGRDAVTERDLRPIAAMVGWEKQRRMWATCCGGGRVTRKREVSRSTLPVLGNLQEFANVSQ